jgi:hypothetical protein
MAETAFQIQYRQEMIKGFEQRNSLLRDSVTTEAVIKGQQATFLIVDSGDKTAVTRGANGNIPYYANNNTQVTATLQEKHGPYKVTGFVDFASQGDQRMAAQMNALSVLHRDVDQVIIDELETATNNTGSAVPATLSLVTKAMTKLGNNKVPFDGQIYGLITPAFLGYLMQIPEFGSADFVQKKPLDGDNAAWMDQPGFYNWSNVKWIVHPELPGVGTSAEKCFLYHKSAIGHAANVGDMRTFMGYDEVDGFSYCRAELFHGAKLLQNSGAVIINHDGSALS